MTLVYKSAASTHPGLCRESNEDAVCGYPEAAIWCVVDGMGGHTAGDVAAQMVVTAVSEVARRQPPPGSLEQAVAAVTTAIHAVNQQLVQAAIDASVMGCTVAVLIARGRAGACLWAGDSRLYLARDSRLYQLSRDHSVVQQLVDNGIVDEQEAATHPERHLLTRAVGAEIDLQLDYLDFDLQPGDLLLLCSDGLYAELVPEEILRALERGPGCQRRVERLIERVLAGPARDNVAVSVIEVCLA